MNRLANIFGPRVRDLCGTYLVSHTIRALRASAASLRSPEEILNFSYQFRSCGIRIAPGQYPEEIIQLLKVLAQNPPRRLLEVGTAGGGTFFLFARIATDDALLISADLPAGPFGGGYPNWRGRLIQAFARPKQSLHLLRADSHAPESLARVQQLLAGQPLDFLFIDGDHRYEGVKADFEMYSPLVKPGGLIGFHDIVTGAPEFVGGVPKFWQEIKPRYGGQEFVRDWKQGGCGIGLIVKEC